MAYRREDKAHGTYADIWVVALDDHLQPIADTNKKIELPRPHPDTGLFEDPRLFLIGGEIYLSFIAATIEKGKHCAAQGLARLSGGWKVGAVAYPDYGTNRNDASCGNGVGQGEKNWTFYEHKGAVRCLYSTEPCSVFELSGERCFDVAKTWLGSGLSTSLVFFPFPFCPAWLVVIAGVLLSEKQQQSQQLISQILSFCCS